jgi:ketosteroid isomerase-like protein
VSHVDHIRSYYEALNTGDAEAVAAHFTEDAVHYYTRLGPHGGKKNPQGDLLGFDHAGRGYTMLEDWKAPAKAASATPNGQT